MKPTLFRFVIAALSLLMLAAIVSPSPASGRTIQRDKPSPKLQAQSAPRFVEGEVIVKFKSAASLAQMQSAARTANSQAVVAKTLAAASTVALVRFPKTVPVQDMVAQFKAQTGVAYAEPNFIASIPDLASTPTQPPTDKLSIEVMPQKGQPTTREIATDGLKTMGTYPNDPSAWWNWGWSYVGAHVIWPEAAASPLVAVLDTGVDYLHPDLAGKVVKGYDYINDDADPMDDYGHGTHVAGIIAAKLNNGTGLAGVSNGQVLAIKVLDSQGGGTYYDIAQGIYAAANNAGVKVINMSLGGNSDSSTLSNAVDFAVNTKGKLLVAAAGNSGTADPLYPAYYATTWPGKVMAVASNGAYFYGSTDGQWYWYRNCKSYFSNYGTWITISAPGYGIYSTTPWDKPFYMNQYEGVPMRYAWLSGTSMATPFVAGTAARTWSLNPTWTNLQISSQMIARQKPLAEYIGQQIDADGDGTPDGVCWPAGTNPNIGATFVAGAMEREAVFGSTLDAMSGLPLTGGQATATVGTAVKGYGGKVEGANSSWFDIINLPRAYAYTIKISKAGYTAVPQAYDSIPNTLDTLCPWCVGWGIDAISVPTNKNSVLVDDWRAWGYSPVDLDNMLWLPPEQDCIVGNGFLLGTLGCGGTGSLLTFPFARRMRDGGPWDVGSEATSIKTFFPTTTAPYKFYIWDVGRKDGTGFIDGGPVVRYWKAGVLLQTIRSWTGTSGGSYTCLQNGGTQPCQWWYVGSLTSAGVFTVQNKFINETLTPLPYGPVRGSLHLQKPAPAPSK